MNKAAEIHNRKRGILLNITPSVETSGSETDVMIGSEIVMNIITEIPKISIIRYFRKIGESSFF